MNPYAAPSAAPTPDHAAPGFEVIQPMTLGVRVVLMLLLMAAMGAVFLTVSRLIAVEGRTSPPWFLIVLPAPVLIFIGTQVTSWWQVARFEKRVRFHPLVQTGKVLYGGAGGLSQFRNGLIFLTADSIELEYRDDLVRIPYRDIAGIRWHRRFGFLPVFALRLRTTSQKTLVLWVTRPKFWWRLIEELKTKSATVEER